MSHKKYTPERTCVGCFQKKFQHQCIVLTRLKSGEILLDSLNRGRSAYLCHDISCFRKACKKQPNAFQRSLKVFVDPEILEQLKAMLQ